MSTLDSALRAIIRDELARVGFGQTPERLAYAVPEFAELVGLSDQQIYNHIARGDLTPKYSGTKRIILAEEARRFLDELPDEDRGPL